MAEENSMNYEKLFDILREERNGIKLQELSPDFYASVAKYLNIKGQGGSDLSNAKTLLNDLYQRREKKIMNLALSKSRTKSNLIDVSALLPEEKTFFKQAVVLFDHFRDEIINSVLEGKEIQAEDEALIEKSEEVEDSAKVSAENGAEDVPKEVSEKIKVKFLKYVDKFVGPDLDILGPFEEGDVAEIPSEAATLVISKELAEKFGE